MTPPAAAEELEQPAAELEPTDDEDEELEGEREESPEASEPADPTEPTKDQLRALDEENRRHERRLHEIMGPFVDDFVPCEPCAGSGIVPPQPPVQSFEAFKACDTCRGYGQVLTGSLRPGCELTDCPRCAGRGYLQRIDQGGGAAGSLPPAPPSSPPELVLASPAGAGNPPPPAPIEEWGVPTWMGDPAIKPAV